MDGETNRGDGIIMATKFDAQLRNMQYIGLGPADYLNGPSKAEASLALTASQLVVNSNAKRFWKGTTDTSVNNSKKMTYIAANQPDAISYFIGDAKMSNYMESNNPGIVEKLKNRGILFMADTLEQLASQINVDANSLTETITAFNGYVDAGIDPDFGRTEFNGKVEAGPYIAFKDQIAYHLTFGGLVTNTEAEVLDTQGAPIPGLYAAGDVTSGIEGTTHRTGDCLLVCVYYGKVAGENAAGL